MTLIDWLDKIDKASFLFIHRATGYPIADNFFLIIRNAITWIPLYGFMLYFALVRFRKKTLLFIVLSIITFILCDRLSAGWLKPLFARSRPCYSAELQPYLRNIIECGGRYSFPSSHAANHFGLAILWYRAVFVTTGRRWKWLWLWAFLIGYAQVYVGKHYPLDIAAGAILGLIVGGAMAKIFEHWPAIRKKYLNNSLFNKSIET